MKRLLTLLLAALLSTAATLHAQEIAEITPPAQAAAETQEHPAQSRPTTIVRRVPGDQDPGKLNANETAILDPQTDEWVVSRHDDMPPARSLADLYLEGGWEWMSLITICLIAMLFSAWKAPRWIKEFGLMALSLGIFSMSVGLYSVFDLIQARASRSPSRCSAAACAWRSSPPCTACWSTSCRSCCASPSNRGSDAPRSDSSESPLPTGPPARSPAFSGQRACGPFFTARAPRRKELAGISTRYPPGLQQQQFAAVSVHRTAGRPACGEQTEQPPALPTPDAPHAAAETPPLVRQIGDRKSVV